MHGRYAAEQKKLKAEYWWFEVLAIFLRSLVTGFFRFGGVMISIVLCLIVTIIHRTFVLQLKPYASSGLQHVVEALMRFALSIVLLSVCLVGDLITEGDNATAIVTFVFLLNLSCLPIAYQAFVSESYRGVARRLQAHEHVEAEEVELDDARSRRLDTVRRLAAAVGQAVRRTRLEHVERGVAVEVDSHRDRLEGRGRARLARVPPAYARLQQLLQVAEEGAVCGRGVG